MTTLVVDAHTNWEVSESGGVVWIYKKRLCGVVYILVSASAGDNTNQ